MLLKIECREISHKLLDFLSIISVKLYKNMPLPGASIAIYFMNKTTWRLLACLQAVSGGFIAENPFRSVIERHLGFLRRALPGTSGRAQKSRGRGRGREETPLPAPLPSLTLSTLYPAQTWQREFKMATSLQIPVFFDHPTACVQARRLLMILDFWIFIISDHFLGFFVLVSKGREYVSRKDAKLFFKHILNTFYFKLTLPNK